MSHTIDLTLDGLSCGHCVKRVKESLEQRPDVESAEVTIDHAAVTGSASAESQHPEMLAAIERVIHCCRQQQKIAGIFCTSGAAAAARIAQGFQFVTPANDVMQLGRASREAIALARGNAIPTTGASGY